MRQLRQPRLAEIVASRLREDILSGRLKEGDVLGNQGQLFTEYQVSLPALREAMRILETDGLITVRRGNVGGAVVHAPSLQRAAQMIAMVLQNRRAMPSEVSVALRYIEPICAGLCAAREDRGEAVVPVLRQIIEDQRENLGDIEAYLRHAGRFHSHLVTLCGNEPLIVVIGALEAIWSAHESQVWQDEAEGLDVEADLSAPLARKTIRAALRAHERLVDAIAKGDGDKASGIAASHVSAAHTNTLASGGHATVVANLLNETGPAS